MATPPAAPAVQGPIIQTSAEMPAPTPPVTTTVDAPKRLPPYRTATFIPAAPAPEKVPAATEKPQALPVAMPVSQPAPHLAAASAQPSLPQSGTTLAQVMTVLRTGATAQQRIWAATTLSTCDGWTNPTVMEALIKAARADADPTVRAACVRCISRMNVCTLPVMSAVQEMKRDRDPQVRAEVDLAIRQLGEIGSVQMR
jgi:hypothetical protein